MGELPFVGCCLTALLFNAGVKAQGLLLAAGVDAYVRAVLEVRLGGVVRTVVEFCTYEGFIALLALELLESSPYFPVDILPGHLILPQELDEAVYVPITICYVLGYH